MTKRHGFTLAEVLITLGIIGVVAAMTIPTLISNTNSAKFRSQFKKSLSTVNQAALMSVAQYEFDYAATDHVCAEAGEGEDPGDMGTENANSIMTFCSIYNGTLSGATPVKDLSTLTSNKGDTYKIMPRSTLIKGATIDTELEPANNYYAYTLADGSLVAFPKTAQKCTVPLGSTVAQKAAADDTFKANCIGFIDVNGATLPNTEVSCDTMTDTGVIGSKSCVVPNDAAHMTDIFPVAFHDSTVEPITNAAQYILTTAK